MAAHSQEDCLYLDVWTPELRPKAALPVMVWFHGGANIAGSAGFDPAYDGVALISRGVILVVAEYRLGIFGFLAHPELARESEHGSSGNYAVLDQIAALKWVQANIAGFGGDPANVTIFGQSAGATDVAALLATPLSEGLFSRAVSESGDDSPAQTRSRDRAETAGVEMARRLGAPASGSLAYLRSLSTADLLKARSSMGHFTVDGWVFPKSPYEVWRDGAARQVPLIIGTNAVELPTPGSPDDLRQAIERELGDLAPKAFALYGLAPGSPAKSPDPVYGDTAAQWGSDAWRSLSILHGEWLSRSGTAVWEYEFDRGIPPNPRATHSGDLPYVFGNFNAKSGNLAGAYTDVDHALSDKVQTYWTNFAKTGNPNGEGAPLWPAYTVAGRAFMRFGMDGQVAAEADQRGPTMALFRDRAKSPDTIP
jgi:para-nitrobenzyl esterase